MFLLPNTIIANQKSTGTPALFAVRGKCGVTAALFASMKKIFGRGLGENGGVPRPAGRGQGLCPWTLPPLKRWTKLLPVLFPALDPYEKN